MNRARTSEAATTAVTVSMFDAMTFSITLLSIEPPLSDAAVTWEPR